MFKRDAMTKYHVSADWLERRCRSGRLQSYKEGRKVYYIENDIKRLIKKGKQL